MRGLRKNSFRQLLNLLVARAAPGQDRLNSFSVFLADARSDFQRAKSREFSVTSVAKEPTLLCNQVEWRFLTVNRCAFTSGKDLNFKLHRKPIPD
jgi:hypothetical protein